MPTESPLRDLMIEIVANETVGLPTIQAAGEVIAADAAFNIRMADAQGNTDFETMRRTAREYEAVITRAKAAWVVYVSESKRDGILAERPHETLFAALKEICDELGKIN